MILGFAEDFTSSVVLDAELTAVPDSGLYFNSGVHESISVDNLLHFLPNLEFTFAAYVAGTTYGKFSDSRKRTDIVSESGKTWQSKVAANLGNTPSSSPNDWLETNIDSLRLKTFIFKVEDRVKTELKLNKRLVDNQYLYAVGDTIKDQPITLSGDFSGWAFEPKGSDYVAIKINQIALQADTASQVDLFVINQGNLIATIVLNPQNGKLVFENSTQILKGKGRFILAFASQSVFNANSFIDPLKYDGFVAYTVNGIGTPAKDSKYSISTIGNGLNFNITAFLDSDSYITDNILYFARFTQATFELEALNVFLANANNRSNRQARIQMNSTLLINETKDLKSNTAARKFNNERKLAVKQLEKTFDRQLGEADDVFEIEVDSI